MLAVPARRPVLLFAWLVVGTVSVAFAACSADRTVDEGDTDGNVADADDGGALSDRGGGDEPAGDAGGHCSTVRGTCDIVLQNCPTGKECTVVSSSGGGLGLTTECVPAGTGSKPAGARCCPNEPNQCIAGLECTGRDCSDASIQPTGRCAPHCCAGDDSVCGTSIPEGFQGTCDITSVVDPGDGGAVPVFHVCSYKGVCKPFHVQSCPTNYACILQSDNVSFRCLAIYAPPGKPAGASCNALNDCADGLMCLRLGDAATCREMCYRADGGAPFDASALRDAAGYGGCLDGATCNDVIRSGPPPWLGFCP
jgi:hypothetical protein